VRKMHLTKKTAFKAAIFIAYILVIILIAEFSLRFIFPQPVLKHDTLTEYVPPIFKNSSYLAWQLNPNASSIHYAVTEEFIVNTTINSLGYRDYEFNLKKSPQTKRVLVIGDSYVFGFGVELNESFTKLLEKKLNSNKNNSYEVINAGYKGNFAEDTQYLYLKNEGLSLKPDLIILAMTLGNDFQDINTNKIYFNGSEPVRAESLVHYIDDLGRLRFINSRESDNFIKRQLYRVNVALSFHSHLYILFKNTFRDALWNFYYGKHQSIYSNEYTADINESFSKVMNYTLKISDLAKSNKIPLIVMIIPDKAAVYDFEVKDANGELLNWTLPSSKINYSVSPTGVKVLDLLPDLKDYVSLTHSMIYFRVDPHWNKEGHSAAADAIYTYLIKNNFIDA
jgi:hypothetical protein